MTREQLISDIILRVTRGKPSDDLELEFSQVAFWIDLLLPGLIKKTLEDKIKKGEMIDPLYLTVEECVDARIKDSSCRECQNNVYFDLCDEPLSLSQDRGIVKFSIENTLADGSDWVDLVSASEVDTLFKLRFSKPSLKNIKAHRVGKRIYLHGLTSDTYFIPKFNITYIAKPSVLEDLDDDDELKIGEELLAILAEEIEKIARRQMYSSAEDEENNARQDMTGATK